MSAFEQFYGLRVAEAMIPKLLDFERAWLREAVEAARLRSGFDADLPRKAVSERILEELGTTPLPPQP